MNRFFTIMCLVLLFMVGGQNVCRAADSWSYPTSKPTNPFGGGYGSYYDPYLINSAQELANLAYMVNNGTRYEGRYFRLTTDIVLNDINIDLSGNVVSGSPKSWTPIGGSKSFKGTFNGEGHTIKGLFINDTDANYQGLFGFVENATICNLNIDNSCIVSPSTSQGKYYGLLCGMSFGSMKCQNVHVMESLLDIKKDECTVGGLIGGSDDTNANEYLLLDNSSFDGNICVGFNSDVAGMVTQCQGIITNCRTRGNIYITREKEGYNVLCGYKAAGLAIRAIGIGQSSVNVENCVNYMDIHIVHNNWNGSLEQRDYLSVSGLCCADIVRNCANFGNLYVGADNDGKIRKISALRFTGAYADVVEDFANYGNVICKGTVETVYDSWYVATTISVYGAHANKKAIRCVNIQKDNVLPTGNKTYKFVLCDISLGNDADISECHSYAVNNSDATVEIISKGEEHSSLSDFTVQPFFNNVNWGVVSVADNSPYSAYNGMPVPASCDGHIIIIEGDGTEANPYIINSEADLKNLQEMVNNGNEVAGKYFRLDADIFGGNISTIGESSDKPFKGHFDGNGHTITGLRNCLFGYMYGMVKNLTLLDVNVIRQSASAALALYVGDGESSINGEISNCYVGGFVAVKHGDNIDKVGGLCTLISDGSKVHDCYFKGTLQANNDFAPGIYMAAGISPSNRNLKGISNCYASFDMRRSGGGHVFGISTSGGMSNCYAIVSGAENQSGCTLLNAEAELSASTLGDQWIQGLYRPVLKGTKYYEVKTPEGETTYLDGIPAEVAVEGGAAANAKPRTKSNGEEVDADALKSNYITCYVPESEEELRDETLWSLPNVAIYSAEYNMDVIPNFYLDNREDLRYTPTEGAKKAMGAMYYPLQQNATGWHMLCLPGYVTKDLFPEGSRLLVVDGVDYDAKTVQVSEADTISAATPFIAYIPLDAEDVSLVSFGDLVFTPRIPTTTSPLVGTFINNTLDDCGTELSSDGKTLLHSLIADIKPFHAWIGGVVEDMEIVSTSTGIKLVGKDNDGNERIYDLRGVEMKSEKGIYIKGGKVRVKAPSSSPRGE
ncbi:MAG: hypothetical protein ACI3YZ_06030 [Prevotella sp.]